MTSLVPRAWRALRRALALVVLAPATLLAQAGGGRIVGTVTDGSGRPVDNAQIMVMGTRLSATSSATGRYAIAGVAAGTHSVKVLAMGMKSATSSVTVAAGQDATLDFKLESAPVQLAGMVVSASRQAERVTDAPATITRIDAPAIERAIGNGYAGVLKEVKGIDIIQTGMTSTGINARGFNSSFNNRMLMMEDGRIAVLPENGLPVGPLTSINRLDLASVEVLVGPGAALYGPDASNGVLTLQTKDPRLFPGSEVEITGGNRSYMDAQFRQAGAGTKWGYKVSGEYQTANDFSNYLKYGPVAGHPDSVPEIGIDWKSSVTRGSGALVRYMGDSRLEVSSGGTIFNGVGQTNVGRNQLKDWKYWNVQARFTSPHWFANAYRAQSLSGDSYAINRYSQNRILQPASISDDSVKKLSDWPADGRLYAGEIQNNFQVQPLLNTHFTWGVQGRQDVVSSKREFLDDRVLGKDLSVKQVGVYAQTETPIFEQLRLILAGRYDKHDDYDAQFSPKVGLLIKPTADQTIRLTYNKAFKSPTMLQNHFNIVDFVPLVGVFGNQRGFTIKDAGGNVVGKIDPLVPEENETYELGYKAIVNETFFFDVAGYVAQYNHFMTPLVTINNPYAGANATIAYQGDDATPIQNANNQRQIVLTYRNLGRAEIRGVDGGFKWLAAPKITVSGTLGLLKMQSVTIPGTIALSAASKRELSALNAPSVRATTGMDFEDLIPRLSSGFAVRYSGDYFFASGINAGYIPQFTTLDLNVSYKLRATNARINLAVNNLLSCSGSVTQRGAYRNHSCGFDQRHTEMYNMPAVGTMLFLGVRYSR